MLDPVTATDFAPRFAGLLWDTQAQTYLTLARAYLPMTGQFLGPDPQLRIPDESKHTHSLYAYCGGDGCDRAIPTAYSVRQWESTLPYEPVVWSV
jgi:RHS repeat-associated protein